MFVCRPPGGTTGGMIEYATSKPLPLPKSPPQQQQQQQQSYKPVPPPKPKNYRPPVQQQQQQQPQQYYQPPPSNGFQHSKSFSMADSTYSSHMSNGVGSIVNICLLINFGLSFENLYVIQNSINL